MLQPLIRLMASRPELLADHARAYAELATIEWRGAADAALRRTLLAVVAGAGLLVGLLLAGMAGLLCAVWSVEKMNLPILLLAIPALPLGIAAVAGILLARLPREPAFSDIRRQFQADLAMLRSAGAE
jgi:hypothetical protein